MAKRLNDMTNKTMTLEKVRDWHLSQRNDFMAEEQVNLGNGYRTAAALRAEKHQAMADAITRHLSQPAERGEAVACNGLIADHIVSGLGKLGATVSKRDAENIRAVLSVMKPIYTAPPPAAGVPKHAKCDACDGNVAYDFMDWCWKCKGSGYVTLPPSVSPASAFVSVLDDTQRLQFVLDHVPHSVLADFGIIPSLDELGEGEAHIDDARSTIDAILSATPSPTIDVAAVREVIAVLSGPGGITSDPEQADKLARAIGDAK